MKRLHLICLIAFSLPALNGYGANKNPLQEEKASTANKTCKTSEKLIPEKLLKVKPMPELKSSVKPSASKPPAAADTFQSLIAPFLKVVSPHFYEHIIKRDNGQTSARS